MYDIVPFCATQRAVCMAVAGVIKKETLGKKNPSLPYANNFFKIFFGNNAPRKRDLAFMAHNSEQTIADVKSELNRLIESNGTDFVYLDRAFIEKAYPSLKTLDRFENKYAMESQRDDKILGKRQAKHQSIKDLQMVILMNLTKSKLTEWVGDTEEILSEFEQHELLSVWYAKNAEDPDTLYSWIYSDMTPMQVAVDLSY